MNAPDKPSNDFAHALALTRDPFPATRGCEIHIAIRPAA